MGIRGVTPELRRGASPEDPEGEAPVPLPLSSRPVSGLHLGAWYWV